MLYDNSVEADKSKREEDEGEDEREVVPNFT